MENFIDLDSNNIAEEHICCAFSDKKCAESYEQKKQWLKSQFANGYIFRRLNARAKVFIEHGPAENSWIPVNAPNYLMINCFWVSGQYKSKGYGKELLKSAIEDGKLQNKSGLVTVVGTKKYNFMSDTKWLLKQGFIDCQRIPSGFSLLVLKFDSNAKNPEFIKSVLSGECPNKEGIVAYYSNRCPFAEFHVKNSLIEATNKRNLECRLIKINSIQQAQSAPSPATIFSLFYNGKFITTDISICLDSRFDKLMEKSLN